MGILGIPLRVTYESKWATPNLQDVVALVTQPDGTEQPLYSLVQFSNPVMKGRYYFDLETNLGSPEGEYTILVMSMSENHEVVAVKGIYAPVTISGIQNLLSALVPINISGVIDDNDTLWGHIDDGDEIISGTILDCWSN